MRIRRLDTERGRDVQQFTSFPVKLYRKCAQWVPPLASEATRALNRREHPFHRHSSAEFFVAEDGHETLGRIAVMHNRRHNEYRDADTAFFGFFDVVEDIEVARALLYTACDWARAHRLDTMIGPRGLLGSGACGILVEGFEQRAARGVPYNYPYYDAFVTDSGLRKDIDYLSGYLGHEQELPDRLYRLAEGAQARRGFWVKSFSRRDELQLWVPRVAQIRCEAYADSYEYYPPTEEETSLENADLFTTVDPRLIKLAIKGEQVIGFIIARQDTPAGQQGAHGHLWPLGWAQMQRRRGQWVSISSAGLLPAYQGLGANAVLYAGLAETLRALHVEHVEVVQVSEADYRSRADMEAIGVQWYKRHRSYRRAL